VTAAKDRVGVLTPMVDQICTHLDERLGGE